MASQASFAATLSAAMSTVFFILIILIKRVNYGDFEGIKPQVNRERTRITIRIRKKQVNSVSGAKLTTRIANNVATFDPIRANRASRLQLCRSNGFSNVTPVRVKSSTLRVTTVAP